MFLTPRFLLLFFFWCSLFAEMNAQEKYRAVNWTIQDGLTSSVTSNMLKDVYGFLWVASEHGLNRFDGSQFRKYFHDPKNPRSIAGNEIIGLVEDSLHNIWIGSLGGLSRFDIKADTFSNFLSTHGYDPNDPNHPFIPFWATANEVFALETNSTLVTFNTSSLVRKVLVQFTK
jgi:ligand-binding sensor domain-containing protein